MENKSDAPGFDILFYNNAQAMWIFDMATFQLLEVNEAATRQYGYTRNEFLTKTIFDLRPAEDIPLAMETVAGLKGDSTTPREFRHQSKNGNIFYVELCSYNMVFRGIDARLVQTYNINEKKVIAYQLESAQTKLEKILETINIGFCQLDNDQKITYWNTAAEELIGYKRADLLGKELAHILPEIIYTEFYTQLQSSIDNKTNAEFIEYFWPLQKWLSVVSHPTADGQTIHFRDATAKIMFQRSLLKKIEQLKDVSYLNSHLIRKPVASLLGLTNMIRDGIVGHDELNEVIGYIHECGLELDEVVKEVNAKINDDNKYEFLLTDISSFPVLRLLEEVTDKYQKNSLYQLVIADKTGNANYFGNRKSIKTAIECLIDNAIKYSPPYSKIVIQTKIEQQNLIFSVQDYGIGIDEDLVKRLYADFSNTENAKDLGSGLTLIAEVAKNHHGTISVKSEKGFGSIFTLTVPLSNVAANRETGKADFSVYKEPIVELKFGTGNYLTANYKGFHDSSSIKAGSKKILNVLDKTKYSKILIDDTELLGVWDGAIDWISTEWFPMAIGSGITHVAVVYAENSSAKISVDKIGLNLNLNVNYKVFKQKSHAVKWLLAADSSLLLSA